MNIRRRDVSPSDIKMKMNSGKKVKKSKMTVDIQHPIVVTFDKVKAIKRHRSKTKMQLKQG